MFHLFARRYWIYRFHSHWTEIVGAFSQNPNIKSKGRIVQVFRLALKTLMNLLAKFRPIYGRVTHAPTQIHNWYTHIVRDTVSRLRFEMTFTCKSNKVLDYIEYGKSSKSCRMMHKKETTWNRIEHSCTVRIKNENRKKTKKNNEDEEEENLLWRNRERWMQCHRRRS